MINIRPVILQNTAVNPATPFTTETIDSATGARILKLKGALTIQTLFDFQDISRKETSKPIIVDISGVPYMDSAGLGSVISVFTSCPRSNRGFAIVGVTDRVRTLFAVTHVDGILPCYDTLEAAETAVKNGPVTLS